MHSLTPRRTHGRRHARLVHVGDTTRRPENVPRAISAIVTDLLPGLIGYVNADLAIVHANERTAAWCRRDIEELPGMHLEELLAPRQFRVVQPLVERAIAGVAVRERHDFPFPDGSTHAVALDLIPNRQGSHTDGFAYWAREIENSGFNDAGIGRAPGGSDQEICRTVAALHRRNTALAREIDARRLSEERYRIVSELVSDLIYVYGIDDHGTMRTVWYTGRLSREFSPQPTPGGHFRLWRPIVHPDDVGVLDARIARLMSNRSSIDEFRVIDGRGRTRWIRLYGKPLLDEGSGRVTRIMVAAQDITDAKSAGQALDNQRRMLDEALASMSEGFLLFDRAGFLVECNQTARELFPESARLMVPGTKVDDLPAVNAWRSPAGRAGPDPSTFADSPACAPRTRRESEFQLGDGRWILAIDRATGDGGMVSIRTDITERKLADENRRLHEAELAQLLRRASMGEMASALAHELSQPLAAIVNYASGLLRRLDAGEIETPALRDILQRIGEAGRRSKEIVNHVGEFVRLGRPEVRLESVQAIVCRVIDLLDGTLARNGITLRHELPPGDVLIHVNRIEIEQVLFNLVRNAIDAIGSCTSDGGRIEVIGERNLPDTLVISVNDSGPGIADHLGETLFQPYVTTKDHGLGMGLSISRTIVEAHGGRLWVDTGRLSGACFRFTIPVILRDQ